MNLNHLTHSEIVSQTLVLVSSERKIGTQILWHLQAIEQKMIYAELGYSSLYEFAIKHLHYSEGSAYRRIDAMRLLKRFSEPEKMEIKNKLEQGELNVSHLSQVQQHLRNSKKAGVRIDQNAALHLINEVSGTSKLEAERILCAKLPDVPLSRTKVSVAGANKVSLSLEISNEDYADLKEWYGFFGGDDLRCALIKAVKIALTQEKKKREPKNKSPCAGDTVRSEFSNLKDRSSDVVPSSLSTSKFRPSDVACSELSASKLQSADIGAIPLEGANLASEAKRNEKVDHKKNAKVKAKERKTPTRFISLKVKRSVAARDGHQCTFRSPSGRRCESKFKLEYDHVIPFALGGTHAENNLRLRCRAHNLLFARQVFGAEKMKEYRHSVN